MNLMVREGCYCTILQQSRTGKLVEYIPALQEASKKIFIPGMLLFYILFQNPNPQQQHS